jgi:hypothetical protein
MINDFRVHEYYRRLNQTVVPVILELGFINLSMSISGKIMSSCKTYTKYFLKPEVSTILLLALEVVR